LPHPCRS